MLGPEIWDIFTDEVIVEAVVKVLAAEMRAATDDLQVDLYTCPPP
jgi:hypothetical protein